MSADGILMCTLLNTSYIAILTLFFTGRGGGAYGSGGSTSRSFTNSSLSHGGRGSTGIFNNNYNSVVSGRFQTPVERPSAQELHSQFGRKLVIFS